MYSNRESVSKKIATKRQEFLSRVRICTDVKQNYGDFRISCYFRGTPSDLRARHPFGANEVIELLRGQIAEF